MPQEQKIIIFIDFFLKIMDFCINSLRSQGISTVFFNPLCRNMQQILWSRSHIHTVVKDPSLLHGVTMVMKI